MSVVTGNYGTNANYSAYSGKASSAPPSYDEDYLDLPTYEEDSEEVLPEYTAEEGGSAVDSSEKTGDISQEQIDQLVQMLTQMIMQFLQQLGLVPPQDESGQTLGAGEELSLIHI